VRSVFEYGGLSWISRARNLTLVRTSAAAKQKIVLVPLAIHFQEINLIFMSLDHPLKTVPMCRPFEYSNGTSSSRIHVVFQVTDVPGVFLEGVDSSLIPVEAMRAKSPMLAPTSTTTGRGSTRAIRID